MKLCGYDWPQGGTKQVVYADDQGQVIELVKAWESPSWQAADLTKLTGAPPADASGTALAGYAWSAGRTKQVVYADDQGHVIELFVAAGSPWHWVDLTALTGAPLLHQNPLTGYGWRLAATKQVAYVDDQGQVIELWVGLNGPWRYTSFTALMRRGVNNSSKEHSLEETRLKS